MTEDLSIDPNKIDPNSIEQNSIDQKNTVNAPAKTDITHILNFLGAETPDAWIKTAIKNLPTIIQDHANCEKKAAGTAMNLIFRYEFHEELQLKLAQLIREEMLHYEQVVGIMKERGQKWQHLSASRYAKGMLKYKRTFEPAAMIDVLIIGAFIEARSCERFAALSDVVEDERLAKYYRYLLKSESRHFEDYIALARSLQPTSDSSNSKDIHSNQLESIEKSDIEKSNKLNKKMQPNFEAFRKATNGSINSNIETLNVDERIEFFRKIEAELITSPDSEIRFHSGIPVQ